MKIINTCTPPINLANLATLNLTDNNAHIFPNSRTSLAAILPIPGSGRVEQRRFIVRASGYILSDATANYTVTLYKGTSLTVGSNTVIKASTARAVNGAASPNQVAAPWMLEAAFSFDLVSGVLQSAVEFQINSLYDVKAAGTAITGLTQAEPINNFVVGVTCSAGDAGVFAYMAEFVLGI